MKGVKSEDGRPDGMTEDGRPKKTEDRRRKMEDGRWKSEKKLQSSVDICSKKTSTSDSSCSAAGLEKQE
jgi:hypothetical protein